MIAFKDFLPDQINPKDRRMSVGYQSLVSAVERANEWISAQSDVSVVNIETVVLPNIYQSREQGSTDTAIRMRGERSDLWHQFVRVWYKTEG